MRKGQIKTQLEDFKRNLEAASEIDCARLAAYIDGEGTIYINQTRPNGEHRSRTHKLSLSVKNNSVILMLWLKKTFWGSAWPDKKNTVSPLTKRIGWTWRVNERQAEAVLRRCLPYFIIKRQQAEIGIAFREIKCIGKPWQRVSEEELLRRDELRNQIHKLNSPPITETDVIN